MTQLTDCLGAPPTDSAPEPGGFAAVFREHQHGLLRFAYLLCGDHHRAEDAVADAIARSFPHWQKGRVEDPGPYLRRAVVNSIRKGHRRRLLERREEERGQHASLEPRLLEDTAADRHALVAALGRLPLKQRAAVVLRYLEDRSEAETAEVLGTTVGSVKTHVHRGVARLRDLLEER